MLDIRSEGVIKIGPIVKTDQEEFILGIGVLQKLRYGVPRRDHFVGHALAGIEEQADRRRDVLTREGQDFLLNIILKEPEVLLFQIRNEVTISIGNADVDEHHVHVDLDGVGRRLSLVGG